MRMRTRTSHLAGLDSSNSYPVASYQEACGLINHNDDAVDAEGESNDDIDDDPTYLL